MNNATTISRKDPIETMYWNQISCFSVFDTFLYWSLNIVKKLMTTRINNSRIYETNGDR